VAAQTKGNVGGKKDVAVSARKRGVPPPPTKPGEKKEMGHYISVERGG